MIGKSRKKVIGFSILGLWLISTLAGYGARATVDYPLWSLGFEALEYIAGAFGLLLVLYSAWLGAVSLYKALTAPGESEEKESPFKEEQLQINQTVENLAEVLNKIERDARLAGRLLDDVYLYTATLVRLVQAIIQKSEQLQAEAGKLGEAIEAIESGQGKRIFAVAGSIGDEHISNLMRFRTTSEAYWEDVISLISAQKGALETWSKGYHDYAGQIMVEIGTAKKQLVALESKVEASNFKRPMLLAQDNLVKASNLLGVGRSGQMPAPVSMPVLEVRDRPATLVRSSHN